MIPYTASLYNGLSRLFGMAFNIDYSVCVIVMAILTGIYVIAGGYMATAINDFIQGMIMVVGIAAVIAAVLKSQGGFMAALDGMGRVTDEAASSTPGVFSSFFGPDPINLLGVVLRDPKREIDRNRKGHFDILRLHRRRRMLFPRRFRKAVCRQGKYRDAGF